LAREVDFVRGAKIIRRRRRRHRRRLRLRKNEEGEESIVYHPCCCQSGGVSSFGCWIVPGLFPSYVVLGEFYASLMVWFWHGCYGYIVHNVDAFHIGVMLSIA
jgi:hypothetical protein